MEGVEDVVIVGAGIAGLATSLGLHRLGIRSLVLESADGLRTSGFALGMWANAWRALDALGIGHVLRAKHIQITGVSTTSVVSGLTTSEVPLSAAMELRCVIRKVLLETLEHELPTTTIRFSSKVVSIETDGCFKSIHLADGTVIKTKVLIGSDGVNSVVAKHLGFNKPSFVGRSAVRGLVYFENCHGFKTNMMHFLGSGVRYGVIPCDDHQLYWFFAFFTSNQAKGIEEDQAKLKQFILSNLGKVPDRIREVIERTELTNMVLSPLRIRHPWELLWGNIARDAICVAGDALHPMTPDMGQGGCAALEDSVVLARALAKTLKDGNGADQDQQRIQKGLENYSRERRWRIIDLIASSYMAGIILQSNGAVMTFIRDKILAKFLAGALVKKASFDCGKLTVS